jgi:hypothetical protein
MQEPHFITRDALEFLDVTNKQDWSLRERADLSARSRGYRPGPYRRAKSVVCAVDDW